MAMKPNAGSLIDKVTFINVSEVPDAHGGFDKVETTFTTRAHIRYLRGGETVQASRLEGKQPAVVTVRRHSQTLQITPETVMKDARRGTIFNVRAVVPTLDRQYIEITAESGVAI